MASMEGIRGLQPRQLHTPQAQTPQQVGQLDGRQVLIAARGPELRAPDPRTPQDPSRFPQMQRQPEIVEPHYQLTRGARFGALDTSDVLISKAGRPKDDISFGFLGSIKMSTGYKALISDLDGYHSAISNDETWRHSGRSDSSRLSDVSYRLEELEGSADRYMTQANHTRKDQIADLRGQIRNERTVIEGLKKEISEGASLPKNMSMEQILAFAREGVPLEIMGDLAHLTPAEARATITERAIDQSLSPAKLRTYMENGFTAVQARLLESSGLGVEGGKTYRAMRLPITEQTVVKDFTDKALAGPMTKLGSGAFNTVFKADYNTSEGVFKAVFKPLAVPDGFTQIEHGWVAHYTGISSVNPQIAVRNLATCALADKLGFNVVARTEIGMSKVEGSSKPAIGLVMTRASGTPAAETSAMVFARADVRREVIKLQLLDHLTAQGDRHSNNYFVSVDSRGKVKVTGIDNDQCLGSRVTNPNGIAYAPTTSREGFRGTNMPPVMDTEMVAAFRKMTPADIEQSMAGLSREEINAAKQRLNGILAHITTLEQQGRIISPDQWGSPAVSKLLTAGNSYVGRDGNNFALDLY